MKGNERIEKFLELQNKDMGFEYISKEIGITVKTLRSFLNRNGYKLENGKYITKENNEIKQIEFKDTNKDKKNNVDNIKNKKTKEEKGINKKDTSKIEKTTKLNSKIDVSIKEKKKNNLKPKKDRKINMTVEDMDKLCEVYDWYMQVKDYKAIKPKSKSSKKDINIENNNINNLKNTSIRVDKKVWEDFERLCSNSQFSKQEIITQALKDFMNEYKHLL
jgi:hypothetical protein